MEQDAEENNYREYLTETLRLIPERKILVKSYHDTVFKTEKVQRSGTEIANDIMTRAGLKFGAKQ